jgi:hypothetical protein
LISRALFSSSVFFSVLVFCAAAKREEHGMGSSRLWWSGGLNWAAGCSSNFFILFPSLPYLWICRFQGFGFCELGFGL